MKKFTYTITFGGRVENHKGMEMIGEEEKEGYNLEELRKICYKFEKLGCECEMILLNEYLDKDVDKYDIDYAVVLVIRKGVQKIINEKNTKNIKKEHQELDQDKKAFMYGKVVNKHARYNLCFADFSQEPDYENKQGRIVNFKDIYYTNMMRESFSKYFGKKAKKLYAEGNYYYDIDKCGIGFHGDSERKVVIGVRLGETLPLHYRWYLEGKNVGELCEIFLNDGDIYIMSEKASGNDWKKKKIPTLRHATGCEKFLKVKE